MIDLTDEALAPSNDAENGLSIGNVLKAKKRKIREQRFVMAMFVLGGYTGQRFNLLHGLIGNYLWQYNAPIKVIDTLHHLGVSASYSGLRKIWHERAKENSSQASVVPKILLLQKRLQRLSIDFNTQLLISRLITTSSLPLAAQVHIRPNTLPVPRCRPAVHCRACSPPTINAMRRR